MDNYIRALTLFLNYAIGQSNFTEEVINEMRRIDEQLVMVKKGTKQINKILHRNRSKLDK